MYWWLIGLDEGKIAIIGPKSSEEEATQAGIEKFPTGDFEVVNLPTRNDARATRLLKGKRLENSTLQEALERVRHPEKNK